MSRKRFTYFFNSDTCFIRWAQPRNGGEGLNDFIEGLGPGQIVGRQVLGTSCLGEIQMGLSDKKGRLEIEIIRARGLVQKPGAKSIPGDLHSLFAHLSWCRRSVSSTAASALLSSSQ